jgi:hypothetical protein
MQTHPGKGVTTFIPDNVATQPRKSASGSPRTLTTQEHGSTGGLRLALGNRRLMLEQAVSIGVDAQAFMSLHEGQARTCVLVGINGNVVAALAIADPLKPEARTVVAALQAQVGGVGRGCRVGVGGRGRGLATGLWNCLCGFYEPPGESCVSCRSHLLCRCY